MGDLLTFPLDRARRAHADGSMPPSFFFDVGDPFSYLAAERVERILGDVEWIAVDGGALGGTHPRGQTLAQRRSAAEARAAALHLPLVWPERFPAATPCALRAAALACELGSGAAFALALSRLAFCGGFELDDPEVLAEAAAAAAVPLDACLEAAGETWRDAELREVAQTLREAGIDAAPAFRIGGRWVHGEQGLSAADVARGESTRRPGRRSAAAPRPARSLAPVG